MRRPTAWLLMILGAGAGAAAFDTSCANAAQCTDGADGDATCVRLFGQAGAACSGGSCVAAVDIDGQAPVRVDTPDALADAQPVTPPPDADCVDRFEGICGGARVVEIAAGYGSACAIRASGSVWCWGANDTAQTGSGPLDTRLPPARVAGLDDVVHVSVGRGSACALRRDRRVLCWGSNAYGQLGHVPGTNDDRTCQPGTAFMGSCNPTPIVVEHLNDAVFVQVSKADKPFVCAVTTAGHVDCWGSNSSPVLGTLAGDAGFLPTPSDLGGQFSTDEDAGAPLCAGYGFACARSSTSGSVRCWGDNTFGQLGGQSTGGSNATPTLVQETSAESTPLAGATALTCYLLGAAANTAAGIHDWYPSGLVANTAGYVEIAGGDAHTCGVNAAGEISCWGSNSDGRLGIATDAGTDSTQHPPGSIAFRGVHVAAGYDYTLAIDPDGAVWGWGAANKNTTPLQLDGGSSHTPRRVEGLP